MSAVFFVCSPQLKTMCLIAWAERYWRERLKDTMDVYLLMVRQVKFMVIEQRWACCFGGEENDCGVGAVSQ